MVDKNPEDVHFTTELLVDGKNSGMFIIRECFPILKQYYNVLNELDKSNHLTSFTKTMFRNSTIDVDFEVVKSFLMKQIEGK